MITIKCDLCKKIIENSKENTGYTHVNLDVPNKWNITSLDICDDCVDKILFKIHVA